MDGEIILVAGRCGHPAPPLHRQPLPDHAPGRRPATVWRRFDLNDKQELITNKVTVFKLDLAKQELVQIKDLRDHASFVSFGSSFFLSVKESPVLTPNCVYLAHDNVKIGTLEKDIVKEVAVYNIQVDALVDHPSKAMVKHSPEIDINAEEPLDPWKEKSPRSAAATVMIGRTCRRTCSSPSSPRWRSQLRRRLPDHGTTTTRRRAGWASAPATTTAPASSPPRLPATEWPPSTASTGNLYRTPPLPDVPPDCLEYDDCFFDDNDGMLYAVIRCVAGEVHAIDLNSPAPVVNVICTQHFRESEYIYCNSYIVRAPWGDLRRVWRRFDVDDDDEEETAPRTDQVMVYRIDPATKDHVLIKDLRGHALFVSFSSYFFVSVEDFPVITPKPCLPCS
uniref:KIB1-4 beta-propeller domain-containing protein n=1 Tax=Oryza punctata TaxID=4537 RepID=A0A0E0JHX6_ORYPU